MPQAKSLPLLGWYLINTLYSEESRDGFKTIEDTHGCANSDWKAVVDGFQAVMAAVAEAEFTQVKGWVMIGVGLMIGNLLKSIKS